MKNVVDKVLKSAKEIVSIYKSTKKETIKLIIEDHDPRNFSMKRPRVGKFSNMYVPDAQKNKKIIRTAIEEQLKNQNFFDAVDFPIQISLLYYTSIPKNFNKVENLLANKRYIRPITKPDIDNMGKTYLDALTSVIWIDDNQVVSLRQEKFYSDNPRVEIEISYIPYHLTKKQIKDKKG